MKKTIYLFTFLLISNLYSQEVSLENQFKVEYNFLGIGAGYELPISEKWLLDLGVGIGGGVDDSDGYVWDFNSSLAFYTKGNLRYYYNRNKREKKGRNNTNNSGNYFGLQTKFFSKRFSESLGIGFLTNSLLTELHWGLQRSLGGNWLFNFHVGFGALRKLDESRGLFSPSIGLKFSYKLF